MPKRTAIDEAADRIIARLQRRANHGGDRRSAAARAARGEVEPPAPERKPPFAEFQLEKASAEVRAAVQGWLPVMWGGPPASGEEARSLAWDIMMAIWAIGTQAEIDEAAGLLIVTAGERSRHTEANANLMLW